MKIKADINATRDSYSTHLSVVDVNKIIEQIDHHPYNTYRGGKEDSIMPMIYNYKKGYQLKDCIKLRFASEKECRQFESIIEDYIENFTSRVYEKER